MGVVRRARQPALGRDVAVKMLKPDADTAVARRRLLAEARVTGALEHPNVVPVYAVGQDDAGRPYLVLRRISGEVWSDRLMEVRDRGGPSDADLRVLVAVCNVVGFAHSRGLLHRDLKPDNVMIGAWGEVYLLDWGLAVALDHRVAGVPQAAAQRRVAGTPSFMAPEQARGEPLGVHTDVWLLGAVLYDLLHGRGPHLVGDPAQDGIEAVLDRAASRRPPVRDDLPSAFRSLLARALAPLPDARFPSAEAFRDALQRTLDERGAQELSTRAARDLVRLESRASDADAVGDVHTLLGASRFGFQQVLERVPGDVEARDGLDRALCAGARWHLLRGEWQAADALLRDAAIVPAGLADAVTEARRTAEAREARLRQIDDTTTGVRTRAFVTAIMGVLWVLTPLVYGVLHGGRIGGYGEGLAFGLVFGAIGLGLGYWARDSLSKSALNRRVRWVLAGPSGVLLLNTAGTWLLGMDPTDAFVMLLLPIAALCMNLAVTFDRRFFVPGLTYVVCFLASAATPSCALAWLSFGNAVVTMTVLLIGARDLGEALADDIEAAVQRRRKPR